MKLRRSSRRRNAGAAGAAEELAEGTVVGIGDRGDGIVETAAGRLYVPFTAPGETIRARPGARRGDGREAALTELILPSADRAAPPCPHFGDCGGCALQHLGDRAYVDWKLGRLQRALAREGIRDYHVAPLARTPPGARRRAVLAVSGGGRRPFVGFNRRSSHEVVDLAACVVLEPAILALVQHLRPLFASLGRNPARAAVSVTLLDGGLDVVVAGGGRLSLVVREKLAAFAREAGVARLSWADAPGRSPEPVVCHRPPAAIFAGMRVPLPPGGFLQASAEGEAALVAAVREGAHGARRVADLFCGAGTLALPLARDGAKVLAADSDPALLDALSAAVRASSPGLAASVRCQARDLFRSPLTADELRGFEAVSFDPPRAGAAAQASELGRSQVPVVIAVSCNPASFARDARTLTDGGYRLQTVFPVDQFVWSPHLEVVAIFRR